MGVFICVVFLVSASSCLAAGELCLRQFSLGTTRRNREGHCMGIVQI